MSKLAKTEKPKEIESASKDIRDYVDLQDKKIKILEEQLRKANRTVFGRKSERYDVPGQETIAELRDKTDIHLAQTLDSVLAATNDGELGLAEAKVGIHRDEKKTQKELAQALKENQHKAKKPNTRSGGRAKLPADLPVVEKEITLPEEERRDEQGNELTVVGYSKTETLGYQPAQYFIQIEKRAIYGKPYDDTTKKITTPSQLVYQKSQFSNEFLAALIEAKFHDHLPMYRIEQHLDTAGLAAFTRQRLSRSLMHVALRPEIQAVYAAIKAEICYHAHVHIDDTTCRMLTPGAKKTTTTRLWALTHGDLAYYYHSMNRSSDHCYDLLKDYQGFVQCDDYAGHNRAFRELPIRRVACMAHIRRKFHDCQPDPFAIEVLRIIQKLYGIEKQLAQRDLSDEQTQYFRNDFARPHLEQLYDMLEDAGKTSLPQSSLGKAISYAIKQRDAMFLYLDHGHLEIDNNNCERAMRRIALGRKNYLFVGNEDGGKTAAIWCSFAETCRRLGIPLQHYLNWLFDRVNKPKIEPHTLTPLAYSKLTKNTSTE